MDEVLSCSGYKARDRTFDEPGKIIRSTCSQASSGRTLGMLEEVLRRGAWSETLAGD